MVGRALFPSLARACAGSVAVLLICGLALPGCGRGPSSAPKGGTPPGQKKVPRVLAEDVGVVRHGQKVQRRFTISNDSQSSWTLLRVHNDCTCTASRPQEKEVLPGRSMEVEVDYTAGHFDLDESHRVEIEFVEPAAPLVWLEMRARVRAPISVFPPQPEMVPDRAGHGKTSFEVHNCTGQDVQLLSVRPSSPWLTVRQPVLLPGRDHAGARQVWRVVVAADASGQPARRQRAHIDIRTDCPEAAVTAVPVEIDLRPTPRASPGQLAFGTVSPRSAATQRVLLRYADEGAAQGLPAVSITHNLGQQLQLSYATKSPGLGELSAVLRAPEQGPGGDLQGVIVITYGNDDLRPLEIPVSAKVQP